MVAEDTMIRVTHVYRRNELSTAERVGKTIKRNFNIVIKGLMLGAITVSSVLTTFADNVFASAENPDMEPLNQTGIEQLAKDTYKDDIHLVSKLNNSVRMLESALKRDEVADWVLSGILNALVVLDTRLDDGVEFNRGGELLDSLVRAELALNEINGGSMEVQNLAKASIGALNSAKSKLLDMKPELVATSSDTAEVKASDGAPTAISPIKVASVGGIMADTPVKDVPQVAVATSKVKFNDMDASAYWAKDIQWLLDNGYMSGYINQKHPTTGKMGNWLNPSGQLTESQMLAVMLRYKVGATEFKKLSTKYASQIKAQSFSAYGSYAKAQDLGMVTKGSVKNKTYQNKAVTRGQLAQSLASMHYGKAVTQNEAIEFMFANNFASGMSASKGKTVENYGANVNLTRAHIATFLSKYNTAVKGNKIVDIAKYAKKPSGGTTATPTPPKQEVTPKYEELKYSNFEEGLFSMRPQSVKTADLVGAKIKTKFGERAYGTKTQAEYDAVMKIVEGWGLSKEHIKTKEYASLPKTFTEAFNNYKSGVKPITDKWQDGYLDPINMQIHAISQTPEAIIKNTNNVEQYKLYLNVFSVTEQKVSSYGKPFDTTKYNPFSAYDLLVLNRGDCTSDAYVTTAINDQLGIDSFVLHSGTRQHDFSVYNFFGKWLTIDMNGKQVEVTKDFLKAGDRILEAPTNGIKSVPTFLQAIYNPTN